METREAAMIYLQKLQKLQIEKKKIKDTITQLDWEILNTRYLIADLLVDAMGRSVRAGDTIMYKNKYYKVKALAYDNMPVIHCLIYKKGLFRKKLRTTNRITRLVVYPHEIVLIKDLNK